MRTGTTSNNGRRVIAKALSYIRGMHPAESKKFHEIADALWEMAKQAKEDRHYELEDTLKTLVDMMHARGSGLRSKYDSIP